MKCSTCHADNRDSAKFCIDCGAAFPALVNCPACGLISKSTKFCNHCGHKFGAESPAVATNIAPPKPELRLVPAQEAVPDVPPDIPPAFPLESKLEPTKKGNIKLRYFLYAAIFCVILSAVGFAAYLFIGSQTPVSVPVPMPASAPAMPPVVTPPSTVPPVQPPEEEIISQPTPAPIVKAAPTPRPQPAPTPKPLEVRPAPTPPPAPMPAPMPKPPQEAQQPFSCDDLPFGLRITCNLEGKDVIRKCAPDLRRWNNDLPGCRRNSSSNSF